MTRYRIEVRPAALRSLRKLDPQVRKRVQGAIALLADDPRPPNSKRLRGRDAFRVRVGDYRIIYTVEDHVLLVVVVTLGHRRAVYKR
ncbi:MAG: type II toxin-antitoxin system RelE/ParE family toxin [Actinomycetota bacterium]|nr:type II toxin-antitoxin system RelE/ParE family toxin [Actinomycetota bacterium]